LATISGKWVKPASANNASISRFAKKKSQNVRIRISNVSKMPRGTFLLRVKVAITLVLGSSSGTYEEKNISKDLAAIVERVNHAKRCPLIVKC